MYWKKEKRKKSCHVWVINVKVRGKMGKKKNAVREPFPNPNTKLAVKRVWVLNDNKPPNALFCSLRLGVGNPTCLETVRMCSHSHSQRKRLLLGFGFSEFSIYIDPHSQIHRNTRTLPYATRTQQAVTTTTTTIFEGLLSSLL